MRLRVLEGVVGRAELDRLHALDQLCFAPTVAYGRDELESFVRHPSAWTAVVEEFGRNDTVELAGFAIVRTWRSHLHVVTIDVAPAARRRGVGRALMEWAEDRALALGLRGMRLEVAVTNEGAQAFYGRLGFAVVGRLEGYYPSGVDALVMEAASAGSAGARGNSARP